MFKSTIQVTLFSILGIVINFVTQLLLAYYFGATQDRDAYFAALTIPAYLTALFNGSVGMMLLPFLVKYQTQHKHDETIRFTSSVINFCMVLMACIICIACVLAAPVMHIMVPSSKPFFLEKSIYLFRIQMLSIFFVVISNLLGSIFQSQHSFFIPAIFPVISSFITLIFVSAFSSIMGINSLAYGTLAGAVISFLFIAVNVLKRFHYHWNLSLIQPGLKSILLASLPLFTAGILFRATTVFERFLAARLPEGSLSYLGTGNQIIVILSTIVSGGIATTSFPLLSRNWSENDLLLLEKNFSRVISLIILIVFPMIIIFVVNGMDIITVLFQRGAFIAKDTRALYLTLLAMMGYFLFGSMGNVVARMLYLSQNTRASAVIAVIELLVYLSCALLLSRIYGFVGLALSLSISTAINIIISLVFIRKKIIDLDISLLLSRVGTIVLLSAIVLLLVFLANKYFLFQVNGFLRSVITGLLVACLYWLLLKRVTKGEFFHSIIGVIKK